MSTRKAAVASGLVKTNKSLGANEQIEAPTTREEEDRPENEMRFNISTISNEEEDYASASSGSNTKETANTNRIKRNSPLLHSPNKKDLKIEAGPIVERASGEDILKKATLQIRGRKSLRESKESVGEILNQLQMKYEKDESGENANSAEGIAVASKEIKEKDTIIENQTTAITMATSSRLTRKSAAQELAVNIRVTRNRQSSSGRPETPPTLSGAATTRGRRSVLGKKIQVHTYGSDASSVKRKRPSLDEDCQITPGDDAASTKLIKIEIKQDDEDEVDETSASTTGITTPIVDNESFKIKQEVVESGDSITLSGNLTAAISSGGRGRSRGNARKHQQQHASPSTRSTRSTRSGTCSPLPSPSDNKRRRRSLLKNNDNAIVLAAALLPSIHQNMPDEDSKDSMGSIVDDLAAVGARTPTQITIKHKDYEVIASNSNTAKDKEGEQGLLQIDKSLSVNKGTAEEDNLQTVAINVVAEKLEASSTTTTEKVPSLSPEIISEGVTEFSVEQIYKKPEFLENNLGIEHDPKLGEIVQKVTTENCDTSAALGNVIMNNETNDNATIEVVRIQNYTEGALIPNVLRKPHSLKEAALQIKESNDYDGKNTHTILGKNALSNLVQHEEEGNMEIGHGDKEGVDNLICPWESENILLSLKNGSKAKSNPSASSPFDEMEENDVNEEDNTMPVIKDLEKQVISNDTLKKNNNFEECDNQENDIENFIIKRNVKGEDEQETNKKSKLEQIVEDANAKCEELKASTTTIVVSGKSNKEEQCIEEEAKGDLQIGTIANLNKDGLKHVGNEEYPIDDFIVMENQIKINPNDMELGSTHDSSTKNNVPGEGAKLILSKILRNDSLGERLQQELALEIMEQQDDYKENIVKQSIDEINFKENDKRDELGNGVKEERTASEELVPNQAIFKLDANEDVAMLDLEDLASNTGDKKKQEEKTIKTIKNTSPDDEEFRKQKEAHLQNLGLVTHKAAEKHRQQASRLNSGHSIASQQNHQVIISGKRVPKASTHYFGHEYTGTLKTVIKLNRSGSASSGLTTSGVYHHSSDGRKGQNQSSKDSGRRQSLKMTFQKGRGRGQATADRMNDNNTNVEDSYYTIQNENEDSSHFESGAHLDGHNLSIGNLSNKKDEKEEILIPEKASSFKFHPGRLCEDQCYYCAGKFGLYDTPCHVGQIKSLERQQRILANEEKLTVDNCLCDACFRHVDRRANVPSHNKKRVNYEISTNVEDNSINVNSNDGRSHTGVGTTVPQECLVPHCDNIAVHTLRRKCIRKSVKKFLNNLDLPQTGSGYVSLCHTHYNTVIQCSGCVLCKRRLGKNHMYHITSDTERLEKALSNMGIPVQLGIGTAVCKLCRYFANLIMKPPDNSKPQKAEFVNKYYKRLLQFHNVHEGSNEGSEIEEDDNQKGCEGGSSSTASASKSKKSKMRNYQQDLISSSNSTNSSVECLGDLSLDEQEERPIQKKEEQHSSACILLNDFVGPMVISTDSNCSELPTSPGTGADNLNKQLSSKLKAILQQNEQSASITEAPSTPRDGTITADISNVLRANPHISMRELFPGEEDLGLNFKAAFGSSSCQRTPEGWTRVQTFLQYDEPTRRLWEDLQKPYGNQSSFLRHLILLEKYFRNGDLVLTSNASSNATVYTQTVRQRLTSFDFSHSGSLTIETKKKVNNNLPTNDNVDINEYNPVEHETESLPAKRSDKSKGSSRSNSVDKISKQLSTSAVTIIARPKQTTAPPTSNNSPSTQTASIALSKDGNHCGQLTSKILPLGPPLSSLSTSSQVSTSTLGQASSNSRSILKANLLGTNKSVEVLSIAPSVSDGGSGELTSLYGCTQLSTTTTESTQSTKQQKILDVANRLLSNQLEATASSGQHKVEGSGTGSIFPTPFLSSPPELISLQKRSNSSLSSNNNGAGVTNSIANSGGSINRRPQLTSSASKASTGTQRNGGSPQIVILPDQLTPQQRMHSKNWRPDLLPVEENQYLLNKPGPLYQTADGRRLPALVQVQSGGKPYLISIFDYNRMCIIRREKLMKEQMLKGGGSFPKNSPPQQQYANSTHHQTQTQMQRNLASLAHFQNFRKAATAKQQQQAVVAQQQLLELMQIQKQQNTTKNAAAPAAAPSRYQPIAPKPAASLNTSACSLSNATSSAPTTTTITSATNNFPSPLMPLLANTAAVANVPNMTAASLGNASWLWNNFSEHNQIMLNGTGSGSVGSGVGNSNIGGNKLPHFLPKLTSAASSATTSSATMTVTSLASKQQQQQLKFPKSLTVIPQHKLLTSIMTSSGGEVSKNDSNFGGRNYKE